MNLVIISMPGSGVKSVVNGVAQLLDMKFVDTDEVMTRNLGLPLHDIYSLIPLETLNDLVLRLGKQLADGAGYVICAGDLILRNKDAMAAISSSAFTVYMHRDPEDIIETDFDSEHPLFARGRQRAIPMFSERKELFEKYADIILPYDATPEMIYQAYIDAVKRSNPEAEIAATDDRLRELLIKRIGLLSESADPQAYAETCLTIISNIATLITKENAAND